MKSVMWLAFAFVLGCGGAVPGFYENPPQSDDALYGVGVGMSSDLQMARTMATEAARVEIARAAETKVNALFKQFREQVNGVEEGEFLQLAADVSKTVTSFVTTATRVSKQEMKREKNGYRVYTLLEMPVGEANAAMVNRIRAQQNLYTRFRASQAFSELERDVAEYEKWKREQ
ncbi:hypothetical protein FJZ36_14005 [Candidatus Poribacteria bacterium]|nr:hypothetical protein [Candidatus Poribacteria bacterium]